MKKSCLSGIIFILAFVISGFSIDTDSSSTKDTPKKMETLLGKTYAFGGFVGLHSKFAKVNERDGYLFGGSVGILLNHSLGLGFAGYGLVSDQWRTYKHFNGNFNKYNVVEMGYGGLLLEPVILPHKVVHLSAPIIIGAGGVGIVTYSDEDFDGDIDAQLNSGTAFFVLEPGLGLQLNVTNFIRIDVGASYRYVPQIFDFEEGNLSNLSGFGGYMSLKLGWF